MGDKEVKDEFCKFMKSNFELEYYENSATVFKTMEMPIRDKMKTTMIKFTRASNLPGM
jgi:hypothetical protein